jgi:hypothetical protein
MAILYRKNLRPVVGWTPRVWKREDKPTRVPLGQAAIDMAAAQAAKVEDLKPAAAVEDQAQDAPKKRKTRKAS